jgi:hypothetical protein
LNSPGKKGRLTILSIKILKKNVSVDFMVFKFAIELDLIDSLGWHPSTRLAACWPISNPSISQGVAYCLKNIARYPKVHHFRIVW